MKYVVIIGGFFNSAVIGYLLTKNTPMTRLEIICFGLASISVAFECFDAIVNEKLLDEYDKNQKEDSL